MMASIVAAIFFLPRTDAGTKAGCGENEHSQQTGLFPGLRSRHPGCERMQALSGFLSRQERKGGRAGTERKGSRSRKVGGGQNFLLRINAPHKYLIFNHL